MNTVQAFVKRSIDVVVSGAALAILSPGLIALAVAVRRSSPGPVLFRQQRSGRNGVQFAICKFRTMVDRAPDLRNSDGSTYSGEDDPRVTSIGRFLRKTSLDELPQLINVFRGEMSLVGPRPDVVDQAQYYTDEERQKLLVRPGITGLAQISGRNSISWEERKRLDVEYVRRQSVSLDISILLRTIPYVLLRRDVNSPQGNRPE